MTHAAEPETPVTDQPNSFDEQAARSRTHVLVATEDEPFLWSVFEGFKGLSRIRVTSCSSVRQTLQICTWDPPGVIIMDLTLLAEEPMALVSLASIAEPNTHIIGLTNRPVQDIGARFGEARLTFLEKPVDVHDLLLLLKLETTARTKALESPYLY